MFSPCSGASSLNSLHKNVCVNLHFQCFLFYSFVLLFLQKLSVLLINDTAFIIVECYQDRCTECSDVMCRDVCQTCVVVIIIIGAETEMLPAQTLLKFLHKCDSSNQLHYTLRT